MLPLPRTVDDANSIAAEVRRLLPAPFVRVVGELGPPNASGGDGARKRCAALYIASVQRLREIVEPEIERQTDHRFPVTKSTARAHDLIGLSSLATCLYALQSLTSPAPAYVSNFDQATLQLSPTTEGSTTNVRFMIKSPNPSGKSSGVAGTLGFPTKP